MKAKETKTTTLQHRATTSEAGYRRIEDALLQLGHLRNALIRHRESARSSHPHAFSFKLQNAHLTWTPGYNPNYVRQEVMRRIAVIRPEDWTTFSLGINVNTYTDTTGESGVTYIYRVQAWKSTGNPSESTNGDEITIP